MLITPGCDRVDRMMFISYNKKNPGLRETFDTFNTLKKSHQQCLLALFIYVVYTSINYKICVLRRK